MNQSARAPGLRWGSWVIVATGSGAGTQALVREPRHGLPGELHERRWRDFGHNRNESLPLARPGR